MCGHSPVWAFTCVTCVGIHLCFSFTCVSHSQLKPPHDVPYPSFSLCRDIKPANVLIMRPPEPKLTSARAPATPPLSSSYIALVPGNGPHKHRGTLGLTASNELVNEDIEAGEAVSNKHDGYDSYKAVLMDFGSASTRCITPATRRDAIALQVGALNQIKGRRATGRSCRPQGQMLHSHPLSGSLPSCISSAHQEDAEANCTATFRAPELFDIPTGRQVWGLVTLERLQVRDVTPITAINLLMYIPPQLDYAKCDIWSVGCLLYGLMYGGQYAASPFQVSEAMKNKLLLKLLSKYGP